MFSFTSEVRYCATPPSDAAPPWARNWSNPESPSKRMAERPSSNCVTSRVGTVMGSAAAESPESVGTKLFADCGGLLTFAEQAASPRSNGIKRNNRKIRILILPSPKVCRFWQQYPACDHGSLFPGQTQLAGKAPQKPDVIVNAVQKRLYLF